MNPKSFLKSLLLLVFASIPGLASAQVPIGGFLSDGAGGPLLSGVVYTVTSNVTVPTSTTLTIQPGAILKFVNLSAQFTVQGNLVALGTLAQPISFTEIGDDSVGGDTNMNGPSSGSPNYWNGLVFLTGSSGNLSHLNLRYAGRNGVSGIEVTDATLTLDACSVSNCSGTGLDLNGSHPTITVTGCDFSSNNRAVEGVQLPILPGFTNNTASGNTVHDSIGVIGGLITENASIVQANMLSNVVILNATLTIGAGTTINVGAGCIFKSLNISTQITVEGVLNATGTAMNPVVFTEIRDDSNGGDTNKNGPSSGTTDYWNGLRFNAAGSNLSNTKVLYGGRNGAALVELHAPITMSNCTVAFSAQAALDMNNLASVVSITNCAFNSSNRAVEGVPLQSVPGFVNNTATGNAVHDSLSLSSAAIPGTTTIGAQNMISNVIVSPVSWSVPAGGVLNLQPGVIVKMSSLSLQVTVSGQLNCSGTAGNPVVFTEFRDDAHGGDSNHDGVSAGTADYWNGLRFDGIDPCTLSNTQVFYCGRNGVAGVEVFGAPVSMSDCKISNSNQAALDLNNLAGAYSFNGCSFMNSNRAVEGVRLEMLPAFVGNVASGNAVHDGIVLSSANITGTTIVTTTNLLGSVLLSPVNWTVGAGASLTLGAGVIVKMQNLSQDVSVSGTLTCNGTSGSPVVFTEFRDDAFGGDSNHDGVSAGAPDFWNGVHLISGSAASVLEHTQVRFAGRNGQAGIQTTDTATLRNCTIQSCSGDGLRFNESAARPIIENCSIISCGGVALNGLRWGALANMRNNTATGNGGNYARITSGIIGTDDIVRSFSCPGATLVMAVNPAFAVGTSLTFEAGVTVKAENLSAFIDVGLGRLEVRGTAFRPVVFTEIRDDEFGGDTNNNGASSGAADFWNGVRLQVGAQASTIDHLRVRYAGRNGQPGFNQASPLVAVTNLRVDHCTGHGAQISNLQGHANNWMVHNCGGSGIRLLGDDFEVRHATVFACNNGIEKLVGWTGTVQNSIAWACTNNLQGLVAGEVFNSDGSSTLAGTDGNIFLDPTFVDAANGDFSLQAGSPCLNAGNVATADLVRADMAEGSRRADDDLSGMVLPDMGALERITWHLDVQGEPRLDATQVYTLYGPPNGLAALLLSGFNTNNQFYPDYGWLLIGFEPEVVPVAILPANQPIAALIPNVPTIIGFPFQVQGIVLNALNTTRGNFSERYRAKVAP